MNYVEGKRLLCIPYVCLSVRPHLHMKECVERRGHRINFAWTLGEARCVRPHAWSTHGKLALCRGEEWFTCERRLNWRLYRATYDGAGYFICDLFFTDFSSLHISATLLFPPLVFSSLLFPSPFLLPPFPFLFFLTLSASSSPRSRTSNLHLSYGLRYLSISSTVASDLQ